MSGCVLISFIHDPRYILADLAVLKLYRQLKKAESAILIQMRTGRIGLAHFLSTAKVPDFPTKQCQCWHGWETPRHVLLQYIVPSRISSTLTLDL
ncbi:reverse transcriptase protein [Rutstroemia sp. NJR-2017a WRK4]|nr:reverse transcriptase protein [Rutstroemia sp. NJR-2017a WRK4]